MRRHLLAPVAVVALVVAGCADDDDAGGPSTSHAEAEAEAEASTVTPASAGTVAPPTAPVTAPATVPASAPGSGSPTAPPATSVTPTTTGASACEDIAGGPDAVAGLPTAQAIAALGVADRFADAVESSGLEGAFDDAPTTVFVPLDVGVAAAAAEAPPLEDVVVGHIVDGRRSVADLVAAGALEGRADLVTVTDTPGGVLVDRGGGPATIVCGDIATADGMIHLVDAPLLPAPVDTAARGGSRLYSVDLSTGAATEIGAFVAETGVLGVTVDVAGGRLLAVTDAAQLLSFPPDDPGAAEAVAITGVDDQTLLGFDLTAEGRLLAVGDASSLFELNPATGAASVVGTGSTPFVDDPGLAVDIDPATGLVRVMSPLGTNVTVDPGALAVTPAATPTYDPEDALNATATPRVVAGAFSPEDGSFYVVDAASATLAVTQSPDSGVLLTVGALGVPVTEGASLDIAPGGLAYLTVPG